jgi:hypothetical protein
VGASGLRSARAAAPCRDYTVESAKLEAIYPDEMKTSIASIFHSSELFSKNFFGETNAAVAHVTEGRFAHVQVLEYKPESSFWDRASLVV